MSRWKSRLAAYTHRAQDVAPYVAQSSSQPEGKSWVENIEKFISYVVAACGVVFAAGHTLGLVQTEWIEKHLLDILFGMISLMTAGMAVILHRMEKSSDEMREIKAELALSKIDQVIALRRAVDPNLDLVFGEHIEEQLRGLQSILMDHTAEVHDVDVFRSFYKKTLETHPEATFFATSVPTRQFFWSSDILNQAMRRFISEHSGTIQRVFFISDADMESPDVENVLKEHHHLGVKVFVASVEKTPARLRKHFMVDDQRRICWETHMGPGGLISSVTLTSKREPADAMIGIFKELVQNHASPYSPRQSDPAVMPAPVPMAAG